MHRKYAWSIPLAVVLGCDGNNTGPVVQPPYLAIVTAIDAPSPIELGQTYTYRVRELSGVLNVDTLITAGPRDTVIVPLSPATYLVTLEDAPAQCALRDGTEQAVVIAPKTNTSLIRYVGTCQSQLLISTLTDGPKPDSQFIYAIHLSDGSRRVGLIGLRDTIRINGLPAGPASVELAHGAGNCSVISNGGLVRQLVLNDQGGFDASFRILCSAEADRPSIVSLLTDYHDGVAGMVLRATAPNRDLQAYGWDITDCHRQSLLPRGYRYRSGIGGSATIGFDTVQVVAALEAELPDSIRATACSAVWVVDAHGNTSNVIEVPFTTAPGQAPFATTFNVRLNGTALLSTQVVANDADGDYLGLFPVVLFRDGTFGTGDGGPDRVITTVDGYLGSFVPDFYFSYVGTTYENATGEILYLFDRAGHFTRLVDEDLFQ